MRQLFNYQQISAANTFRSVTESTRLTADMGNSLFQFKEIQIKLENENTREDNHWSSSKTGALLKRLLNATLDVSWISFKTSNQPFSANCKNSLRLPAINLPP